MSLWRSVTHLFIWQGSSFLVPLVVTPYLARALGIHAYGTYGMVVAITAYANLIVDWGFNLSATQKTARLHGKAAELRALFWNTMVAKFILMLLALIVLILIPFTVNQFSAIRKEILAGGLSVIATGFTANWFLQGQQRMGVFALASLIGRLLTIPLVLLLVHRPDDVTIAILIQGATQIVSAIASLYVASRILPLGKVQIHFRQVFAELADGWLQFVSGVSVAMYTQANALVVGLRANRVEAGLMTGSQRLQGASLGMIQPVTLALYPYINNITETDPRRAPAIMLRLGVVQFVYGCVLGLAMYLTAPFVVPLFLGEEFRRAVPVVEVLALLPPLAGLTNTLGSNTLLPLGLKKGYTISLILAGLLNVCILWVLASRYGALGGACSSVITEIFLVICMAVALYSGRSAIRKLTDWPVEASRAGRED